MYLAGRKRIEKLVNRFLYRLGFEMPISRSDGPTPAIYEIVLEKLTKTDP